MATLFLDVGIFITTEDELIYLGDVSFFPVPKSLRDNLKDNLCNLPAGVVSIIVSYLSAGEFILAEEVTVVKEESMSVKQQPLSLIQELVSVPILPAASLTVKQNAHSEKIVNVRTCSMSCLIS